MTTREALGTEGKVLPFRRRSSAVRVRRRSPWLALLAPLVQAVIVVGSPIVLLSWLLTSPTFALTTIDVEGNRFVEKGWVEAALAPLGGENLLRLSLAEVERQVAANPWVAEVTVEKRLPDRLRLAVVERRPAALLRAPRGLVVLDRAGRRIAPLEPKHGAQNLLLVSLGAATEVDLGGALAIADELARVDPVWGATLSEVEVLSEDDYRLYMGALDFPLAVRAGTLESKVPELKTLLPELARRYPGVRGVDLRFSRRIVFQPMVGNSVVERFRGWRKQTIT